MRIIILATVALSIINITQAAYTIIIPMEQSRGGALSNGSIKFIPINWQPAEPIYGEWINVNDIYGCSNWTPATSTEYIGVVIQQTATDCKQDQTRTKQNREQETYTLAYRNIGQPTSETKTIAANSSRQATGTKPKTLTCKFGNNQGYWINRDGTSRVVWWDAVYGIIDRTMTAPPSYTEGGYTYTRGNYVSLEGSVSAGYSAYYYICRE